MMQRAFRLARHPFAARHLKVRHWSDLIHCVAGRTPVLLDSPHSGSFYPSDFDHACERLALRQAEHAHVERVFEGAVAPGAAWIEARFPLSYLDVDEDVAAWPPGVQASEEPVSPAVMVGARAGQGLVWTRLADGTPIYVRPLTATEVRARVATCWVPYRAAVRRALDAAHARHGYSLYVNCGASPAACEPGGPFSPPPADFMVGQYGNAPGLTALAGRLAESLRALGYSVGEHPAAGAGELVRRHADASRHQYALQLRVRRALFMDEHTLEITPGLGRLQWDMRRVVEGLIAFDPR